MSNPILVPIVSDVTAAEALRSGANTDKGKQLEPAQKKKVAGFIAAHARTNAQPNTNNTNTNTNNSIEKRNLQAGLAQPQVTSTEQAVAVAAKGRDDIYRSDKFSVSRKLYKTLYTPDPVFLKRDLESYEQSLSNQSKSLADTATGLNPQEKALRKYLLIQIALENESLPDDQRKLFTKAQSELMKEHGDFIKSSLSALEVGQSIKMPAIKLRDFIRAYQMLEVEVTDPNKDPRTSDLLDVFRAIIKKDAHRADFTAEMVKMHNGFVEILTREKSQNPTKITSTRQHLILCRIQQMGLLIKTQALHKKFLDACGKANIFALPKLADLMEACIQIVASPDIFAGINSIVRMASGVDSKRQAAQNIFMTNFNRLILQSDLLKNLYKNPFHKRQVIEYLDKASKAAGILTAGAANAA